mgnify:CR=1 FL=1
MLKYCITAYRSGVAVAGCTCSEEDVKQIVNNYELCGFSVRVELT